MAPAHQVLSGSVAETQTYPSHFVLVSRVLVSTDVAVLWCACPEALREPAAAAQQPQ